MPHFLFVPSQVSVYFGGDEIPDSPFEMTSNPDLKDVIDLDDGGRRNSKGRLPTTASETKKKKEERDQEVEEEEEDLQPERNFSRHGTGMQRRKDSKGNNN